MKQSRRDVGAFFVLSPGSCSFFAAFSWFPLIVFYSLHYRILLIASLFLFSIPLVTSLFLFSVPFVCSQFPLQYSLGIRPVSLQFSFCLQFSLFSFQVQFSPGPLYFSFYYIFPFVCILQYCFCRFGLIFKWVMTEGVGVF